jgi:hypothetical protein
MFDLAQEAFEYEANARYDYVREAYAATALDPYEEGYSNYVFDAEDAGEEVLEFADWKAREKARMDALRSTPFSWVDATDDCPF